MHRRSLRRPKGRSGVLGPRALLTALPTSNAGDMAVQRSSSGEVSSSVTRPFNDQMTQQFRRAAELLEAQGADGYRIRAYRRAADELHSLKQPVSDIYRKRGIAGLVAIPTIGEALAQAIADNVDFGSWRWLDRLQGSVEPERVLGTVAGIGPVLATRIHDRLGIESLEDFERAAHDGRLATVDGFGPKRLQSVKDSLTGRLHQGRRPALREGLAASGVSLKELLDVDAEYRDKAERGELPRIAPRRFNPEAESWLPILHTVRGNHHFTAMYSNTARANQLGRTNNWVVIYQDDPEGGQWTAVTPIRGPKAGKRLIRGPLSK